MPPHTSDQVQPLDLGVFAIQKRFMSSYTPHKKYSDQTRQLIKARVSVQRACVPPVIIAAFRRAGIIHNQTPAGIFGKVEKRFMTAVRHFNLPAEDDDLDQLMNSSSIERESQFLSLKKFSIGLQNKLRTFGGISRHRGVFPGTL